MPISVRKTIPNKELGATRAQHNQLQADVASLISKFNALVSLVNDLKAKFNAHTHGGVTTGAGSTAGPSASTTVADGTTTSITADTVQTVG
jgi:hypothetical protein